MTNLQRQSVPVTAFSIWLRTGRRVEAAPIEVKFNPWHDREDGRFTFVGQGDYFPSGRRPEAGAAEHHQRGGTSGAGVSREEMTDAERAFIRHDPKNPRNHGIYTVKPGDTLTAIAARRRGLRVSDLTWLNDLDERHPLRVGQQIKIPHQWFLDEGKRAFDKRNALFYYIRTHGRFPPNPANPPSVESQILDTNWRRETRGTYDYWIDIIERPREAFGQVVEGKVKRSRTNQIHAGGADRRPTDEGGHYIANRFNGPSDAFNHFAQDRNFNRSAYSAMENAWAKHIRDGRKVFVRIKPHYIGTSSRPHRLTVEWTVDGGKPEVQEFRNESRGARRGKR